MRYIPYSWIRRLSIDKMKVIFKFSFVFNTGKLKISVSWFEDIDKLLIKCV